MSRFISAGTTDDEPTERDEAWLAAQQKIEASQQAKKMQASGQQDGGKSLYETLQANKAAKQDAFEESIRLRNQFRSLDEDEVEFLDSVMESTRKKEAEVRKENLEQLELFKRQQEEAEKAATAIDDGEEVAEATGGWKSGPRKRKKGREGLVGGVKVRRTSSMAEKGGLEKADAEAASPPTASAKSASPEVDEGVETKSGETTQASNGASELAKPAPAISAASPKTPLATADTTPKAALGLVAYSSDEEDED